MTISIDMHVRILSTALDDALKSADQKRYHNPKAQALYNIAREKFEEEYADVIADYKNHWDDLLGH